MTDLPDPSMLSLPRRRYSQPDLRVVAFEMAGQEYVVDVAQVQEIIRPMALLHISGMPEDVEGLVKRRGRIVPIVDLRKRMGLPVGPITPETCILISPLSIGPVGFQVDSASELMWVKTAAFEIPSPLLARPDQRYVQGVAHLGERALVMLDLELLLSHAEQQRLQGLGQGEGETDG
jgi:purine-binding chemotaxis protein CheW